MSLPTVSVEVYNSVIEDNYDMKDYDNLDACMDVYCDFMAEHVKNNPILVQHVCSLIVSIEDRMNDKYGKGAGVMAGFLGMSIFRDVVRCFDRQIAKDEIMGPGDTNE